MEIVLDKWDESISVTKKEQEVIDTYLNFNKKNKHKMGSIPVFDLIENNII
jgi:hypothetical protein